MMSLGSHYMTYRMNIVSEFENAVANVIMERIEREIINENAHFVDVKIKMNKDWVIQALLEKLERDGRENENTKQKNATEL